MTDDTTYTYRQDLVEFVLALVAELVRFLKAHPDAVGVLLAAWHAYRDATRQRAEYQVPADCPF